MSKMTLSQRAMKLAEEVGEVNEAVLCYTGTHGTQHKPEMGPREIAEEALDVIIVATSILAELGMDDWTIQQLLDKKMSKWEWRLLKLRENQ